MPIEQIIFEAVKLALQFGGALFIARAAVRWALKRYKQEKHWERRLSAYADVVTAMTSVLEVLSAWETQELGVHDHSEERTVELRGRYRKARNTLDEARGLAMLLLPQRVTDRLDELSKGLYKNDGSHEDFLDEINTEWQLVSAALEDIVRVGRLDLDLTTD